MDVFLRIAHLGPIYPMHEIYKTWWWMFLSCMVGPNISIGSRVRQAGPQPVCLLNECRTQLTTTLCTIVELCGTLWNFVEQCGTLWSSVACTDARRTETVNKAARLDHTAPNQCSITDFIESNMINDVYTLLSICSLRLQTLTPLLGRLFSSDIELALLNQAS